MYKITLLRHGESQGNAEGIIQGQSDFTLTEKGRQQARQLASTWQADKVSFDLIISSPLKRARWTAETIAAALNVPTIFDPDWMERSFGHFEGLPVKDIEAQNPDFEFHHPYSRVGENGESNMELYLRACRAVWNVIQRPPGHYLVVSHGAILNMALYSLMGLTPVSNYNSPRFRFGNTAYANLSYDPQRCQWWILSLTNPSPRLETEKLV